MRFLLALLLGSALATAVCNDRLFPGYERKAFNAILHATEK